MEKGSRFDGLRSLCCVREVCGEESGRGGVLGEFGVCAGEGGTEEWVVELVLVEGRGEGAGKAGEW